jgi:hypothetical protein
MRNGSIRTSQRANPMGSVRPCQDSHDRGAIMPFRDRVDAGRKLARALRKLEVMKALSWRCRAVGCRWPRKSRQRCTRPSI